MERKAKTGISAWLAIGIIFMIVGMSFIAAETVILVTLKDIDPISFWLFLFIFGGMGLLFLGLGLIFFIHEMVKKVRSNKLLNTGNYVMAEITEITVNHTVKVNGRHPYIIKCIYQDMAGNIHIFKSRDLYFDPGTLLREQKVKVYVDGKDFKYYYVDIDEILPKVIQH